MRTVARAELAGKIRELETAVQGLREKKQRQARALANLKQLLQVRQRPEEGGL